MRGSKVSKHQSRAALCALATVYDSIIVLMVMPSSEIKSLGVIFHLKASSNKGGKYGRNETEWGTWHPSWWAEFSADSGECRVTLLFWLKEKGHYTGSQRGKQLSPDKVMTSFLQGREYGTGNIGPEVGAWTHAACASAVFIFSYLRVTKKVSHI